MAQAFNLTAQINLQGPSASSIKPIVAQIKRQLSGATVDVKVKIDPKAASSIDAITGRLQKMNNVLAQAQGNLSNLNASLNTLATGFNTTSSGIGKTQSSIDKTTSSVKSATSGLKVATTRMEEFGRQSALAVKRFAAFSFVTTGIYALVNAVNSGFKAFINFDRQLIKLQQVTGQGAIGLKSLEKEITNLAINLGVSSEGLIEVASTLAQAGLSADDTRIALAALAKTELAPSFDNITETTEGAIAAMRQFGIAASDLEAVLGSINAVAAAFAVESKDIITAIQRTGGVFATASKGVSEGKDALNEFIAVFTSVRATTRESAETIATGLRTIFTRIQRADTIKQLRQFGVELTDIEGKFVGPYEAVKRLSAALNQLDPRDIRFSTIVEELGGFRQIGKVIPLIQQFSEAQKALGVAQRGQSSLSEAQRKAQESLANQLAKVREQFLALIRDIGKSSAFQGLFKIVTGLASGLISLASAFKPILPILGIIGAIKGVSALTQFASGFSGALGKAGGAKQIGSNIGEKVSGAREKEKADATARAAEAINDNTSALISLTSSIDTLNNTISSRGGATLNFGGKVMAFARGGVVPGTGNRDTVPAMLQPGEFVIRKKAVESIGTDNLHNMNKYASGGKIQKFKDGKEVKRRVQSASGDLQKSHIGGDLKITKDFIKAYANSDYESSKFYTSLELLTGYTRKNLQSGKFDTDKLSKEMGLKLKDRVILNLPGSWNQALRSNDPDLVATENLAKFIENSKGLFAGQYSGSSKTEAKQTQKLLSQKIKKIKGKKYDDSNNPNVFAINSDDEIKSLEGIISSNLGSPEFVDMLFKAAGKDAVYVSSKTGKARKRLQSRTSARYDKLNLGGKIQKFAQGGKGLKATGQYDEQEMLDAIIMYQGGSGPLARAMLNKDFIFTDRNEAYDTEDVVSRLQAASQFALPKQLYSGLGKGQFGEILKDTNLDPNLLVSNTSDALKSLVGKVIDFPTFLSTTIDKEVAQNFLKDPGAMLNIDTSKSKTKGIDILGAKQQTVAGGVKASRRLPGIEKIDPTKLKSYDEEKEFVLPPSTKFKILQATGKVANTLGDKLGGNEIKSDDGNFLLAAFEALDNPTTELDLGVQMLAKGGFISKFMAGGVASAQDMQDDLIERIRKLGGPKSARELAGLPKVMAGMFNSNSIRSGKRLDQLQSYLAIAEKKSEELELERKRAIANSNQFALVGLQPFGYNKTFGPEDPLDADGKKTYIIAKGLDTQYIDIVEEMQKELAGASAKYAEKIQMRKIFGGSGPLVFDLDDTLITGADIMGDAGNPDIPAYSDLTKVGEALKNATLTPLGEQLKARLTNDPSLLDSIRILTARPQSNADLISKTLDKLGLPIPASKITGVSGAGNKINNIGELETLIDDRAETIEQFAKAGKRGIQYSPVMGDLSGAAVRAGQAAMEGAAAEKILANLGAPLREDAPANRPIDYPDGLGAAAQYWNVDPNMPTEVKRTIDGDSLARTREEIARYYAENVQAFADGGKAKDVLERYYKDASQFNLALADKQNLSKEQRQQLASDIKSMRSLRTSAPKELFSSISRVAFDKMASDVGLNKNPNIPEGTQLFDQDKYYQTEVSKIVGKSFGLPGFVSTSKNFAKAKTFLDNAPRSKDKWAAMMTILTKQGASGVDVAEQLKGRQIEAFEEAINPRTGKAERFIMNQPSSEEEFVLSPNSRFKINRAKYVNMLGNKNIWMDVEQFAKGGSAEDTVPAMLTPGEFVINKKAAQKIGYAHLHELNQADKLQGFNGGGAVGFVQAFAKGGKTPKADRTLTKEQRKKIKEDYLAQQRGGITREEAFVVGTPRPDFGANASRKKDVMARPQGEMNVKKIEAQVKSNHDKLFAEEEKKIEELYDQLTKLATDRFFKGEIDLAQLDKEVESLLQERFAVTEQRRIEIGAQSAQAQAAAVDKYKRGGQAGRTEERQTQRTEAFNKEVQDAMDQVVKDAKAKYKKLYDEERQSLKTFYSERIKQVQAEGGDVQAVITEYKGAVADAKQALETGLKTEITQQQAAVPENIAAGKRQLVEQKRATDAGFASPEEARAATEAAAAAQALADGLALLTIRAKRAGTSVDDFIDNVADKALSAASDTDTIKQKQEDFKFGGIENQAEYRKIFKTGTDREQQKLQSTLRKQLSEANPELTTKQLDEAVNHIVDKMKNTGDSFDQIINSSQILTETMNAQTDVVKQAEAAYEELVQQLGEEIVKQKVGTKEEFIKKAKRKEEESAIVKASREKFGSSGEQLAKIFPDLAAKLNKSKLGDNLAKLDSFFSTEKVQGKITSGLGSLFSKIGVGKDAAKGLSTAISGKLGGVINKLGGPAAAAGAALSIVGNQLPNIFESLDKAFGTKIGKSTAAAGFAGAIGGIGTGAASGAALLSFIPGGAALGAALGALVGAITGAADAIANKTLENTLENLKTTSGKLDKAFIELDKDASATNFAKVDEALAASLSVTGDLQAQSTAGTSYFNPLNYFDNVSVTAATQKEARNTFAQKAGADIENVSRRTMKEASLMSNEEFNKRYESAQRAKQPGATQADMAAVAESSMIVEQYKKSGKTAADAYRAAYVAEQVKMGRDVGEVMDEVARNEAKVVEEGKKLVAEREAENLRLIALEKATKAVQIAAEALTQTFRKIDGALTRFADETSNLDAELQSQIGDLTGNAKIRGVSRKQEQVLGNISGYSLQEVQQAAQMAGNIAGGGEAGQRVQQSAVAAKVLQDELPDILRSAGTGAGPEDVINKIEEALGRTGVSAETAKPIVDELRKTLEAQSETGTSLAEISSMDALKIAGDAAAKGLETAQKILKTYNDTLQESINYMNQQNDLLAQSLDYTRKANEIRLNSEIEIARMRGQPLSLQQMNAPLETNVRSLTGGVIAGGSMDPEAIGRAIQETQRTIESQQAALDKKVLQGPASQNAADIQAFNTELMASQKAIQDNKFALDQANKGLQTLASDTTRAANAMKFIEERQKIAGAGVDALTKIITMDTGELANLNQQLVAATRVTSGTATPQELQSLSFRQAAAGGQDFISSLLPENLVRKNRAMLLRQSLGAAGTDMNQNIGSYYDDESGKLVSMSIEKALQLYEKGPEDAVLEEYKKATQIMADANDALAQVYKDASDKLTQAINNLSARLTGDFQAALQEAGPKQQAEAQAKAAEATKPTATGKPGAQKTTAAQTSEAQAAPGSGLATAVRAAAAAQATQQTANTIDAALSSQNNRTEQILSPYTAPLNQQPTQAAATVATIGTPIMEPDIFKRNLASAQAKSVTEELTQLAFTKTAQEQEISKLQRNAKAGKLARMASGTKELTKPELKLQTAQETLAEIDRQIAEKQQQVEQLNIESQTAVRRAATQPTTPQIQAQPRAPIPAPTPPGVKPTTMTVPAGPIPSPLRTTPLAATAATTVGTSREQARGGMAGVLTLDEQSRAFLGTFGETLKSFGTYVKQLAEIKIPTIPKKIEMIGNHVVDVRITGAAAFEALKKDFTDMLTVEIGKKMNKIWTQSYGKFGEPLK